jgi:hypothetical protein
MNALGEIGVKSHPGWCLDHCFGFDAHHYTSSLFIPCFSDDPNTDVETRGKSYSPAFEFFCFLIVVLTSLLNAKIIAPLLDYHKFVFDTNTGQLSSPSNYWSLSALGDVPKLCLGYQDGILVPKVCSGDDRQKFSFIGQYQSADSLNWAVISAGNLPWTLEFDRNPLGLAISSTYESEDDSQ